MLFRSFSSFLCLSSVLLGCFVGNLATVRAQTVVPEVATRSGEIERAVSPGTPRQQAWLNASIDRRVRLAEQLGDEGARAYATSKRWGLVFDGTSRGVIQGPDQVYRATDGIVHVIEAKGGGGQLGRAYG